MEVITWAWNAKFITLENAMEVPIMDFRWSKQF